MKKLYSVTNFSEGINESSPQGASEVKNFNITNDGVLETRRGWTRNNSFSLSELSDTGSPMQIFFANQKLLMQTTNGLYYGVNDTWSAVTNQTGETGSTYTAYFTARLKLVVADNNRVFLASTDANLWLDTSETAPALYKWGIDAPSDRSDGDLVFSAGSGLAEGEYAYAFAYEGKFGAMSPLSARIVKSISATGSIAIALPSTSGLDVQIEKIIIYRTEKVTQVSFPEGQPYERVLAKNAPLKKIGEVAKASMGSGFTDSLTTIGLAPLAGQLESAAKPPNNLTNITLYGGRIWGSVGSTGKLVFSALDETAAPLYDIFPDESSVIPHVINVRNNITGIGASRDYLAVFSERSIQLVRGRGVISGIYGKQQPGTDLDLSQYLTLMGAKDDWCVAESLGNVYFYSEYDQRVYRIDRDGNVAWISQAIQDLLDSLEVPADSVIHQLVAHEGSVYLVRRSIGDITLLQFDELRDQWTSHNFGSSANMTSFVSNPSAKANEHGIGLYALRDVDDQVAKVFPRSGAGSTSDNSTEIVPSYTSQEFTFTKPTRLDAVRIGTEDEQEGNVRLDIWVDGVLEASPTGRTLSKNNNFTIRCFQRGYKHKVGFTLTGEQTVRFFELQFRSR
jgi:hypothetical protein